MLNTPLKRIRTLSRVQGAGRSLSMRRAWYADDKAQDANGGEQKKDDAAKDPSDKSGEGADDDSSLAKLSPEALAAIVRELRRENGGWRTKLREEEAAKTEAQKAAEKAARERQAAEEKKLAEQGDYKTLAEQRAAEIEQLKAKAERADSYEQKLKARNEARVKAIPESQRKLVPINYSAEQLEEWLDASQELLAKPLAPVLDAGKKGEKKAPPDPAKTLKPIKF